MLTRPVGPVRPASPLTWRRAVLAAYACFLLVVFLEPTPTLPSHSVTLVLRLVGLAGTGGTPSRGHAEFVCNVLILLPLPWLASSLRPLARLGWRDWTALGFVGSGAVELVQALLLPSRSATFSDVVANTLGVGCGAVAALLARRMWRFRT